ncbi:type II secretion system F family protein [Gemmata sp.]|uniref:type II secretion system F family protein n=1 Tax=Gemmata sp. TaxID=1914242 RepID=UPI003F71231E
MAPADWVPILVFLSITAGVLVAASLLAPSRDRDRVAERVRGLSAAGRQRVAAGSVGRRLRGFFTRMAAPPPPNDAHAPDPTRLRLTQAGYDGAHASGVLRAVRLALVGAPLAAAGAAVAAGVVKLEVGAFAGLGLAAAGVIAPGLWLEARKKKRQNELRRGLPDFFDVIVLCVEGGMSLLAAWRRVADELRSAYPTLWRELKLVEHEVEIGRAMGDALLRCGERTDLDEVTSLASVVRQSERVGTELARPMRDLSNTLRLQRVQRAEEAAHKTATKIMFPTLLFIFPCVFAVLLGPMIIQVLAMFSGAKK